MKSGKGMSTFYHLVDILAFPGVETDGNSSSSKTRALDGFSVADA